MAFYWYQSDPDLYRAEVQAMNKFFPSFTIHQLPDGSGRLYWRGKVQPAGPDGMVWDLMLIYKMIILMQAHRNMAVRSRFFRYSRG